MLAAVLTGCQSASMESGAGSTTTSVGYAAEFPKLTCGGAKGRAAKLTASRVRAGDPAYMEFRQRRTLSIPTGHMYVVFGRLDEKGNPVTRQYIGLFPKGGAAGFYAGAMAPISADLAPDYADCSYHVSAAYRVSLSEDQYGRLLGKVRSTLANPPKWSMFGFNCNHFAASLGEVAGLREPPKADHDLPSFSYIHAYIKANGDG
jgi:hypothetical protein